MPGADLVLPWMSFSESDKGELAAQTQEIHSSCRFGSVVSKRLYVGSPNLFLLPTWFRVRIFYFVNDIMMVPLLFLVVQSSKVISNGLYVFTQNKEDSQWDMKKEVVVSRESR